MKFDIHIHSKYSFDSMSGIHRILRRAKRKKMDFIAITDHETIRGGIEASKLNKNTNLEVIVGAEIKSDRGDIIGLFLTKEITSRIWHEVIQEIKDQGGIVVLPHPYTGHKLCEELLSKVDVIEVFNARDSEENNAKALELARKHNKPVVAGSDAHFSWHVGLSATQGTGSNSREAILSHEKSMKTKKSALYSYHLSQAIKHYRDRKWKKCFKELEYVMRNYIKTRVFRS